MAQLYQQEFKTQEKAKYEHIKQAKEKAIEEQRISEKINEELKLKNKPNLTESQENMIRQLNNLTPKGRKKLAEKMKMREVYQTQQLVTLLEAIGLA